jgi:hypothetical protein
MRTFAYIRIAVFVALAASSPTFGQVPGAILSGTITDPSNAVIPNATVTIRNISTGVAVQVSSNSTGIYNAPNCCPGNTRSM